MLVREIYLGSLIMQIFCWFNAKGAKVLNIMLILRRKKIQDFQQVF